jgi:AraC family transcriptional regulator
MQVLKSKGVINGFRAIEFNQLVPEIVELGEQWEPPRFHEETHRHRHWELSYIADGAVELQVGVRHASYLLSGGSFWSIPADTSHSVRLGSDGSHHRKFLGLVLSMVTERHPEWVSQQSLGQPLVLRDVHHFEQAFTKVIAEGTHPSPYQADALRLAIDGLLLEIVRQSSNSHQRVSSVAIHPGVSRALNCLQTRFRERWTLERLADEAGISRARLAELFRQQVGSSIHKTLNKIRIEYAQMLLESSDLSVQAVAKDCGFATSQHFARIFRRIAGTSALEYRRQLLAPALVDAIGPVKMRQGVAVAGLA